MSHSEHLIKNLVRHALKSMEGSPAAVTVSVENVRKEVIERLDKGSYPQHVLDEYSDNPFDKYPYVQLQQMHTKIQEAMKRKERITKHSDAMTRRGI